ncbi:MAG: patatin-like phospholipase family protein [Pseudomonadota bacterium]
MIKKQSLKSINLALQGGGAHGAFAWGVLDKLCEDGRLTVDGLSAASAGSMNAAVYSYGRMLGGLDGAREALYNFWKDISNTGAQLNPIKPTWWEQFFGGWEYIDHSLSYIMFENFTKTFSPYEFNPFNFNPLRDVLSRHVNFDELKYCNSTRMFICATNVRTNKIKVFRNEEISCDAVLASACLPMLFQAVEIDGEAYWDGGYMGNPALYPLVYHTKTEDIAIIHINPIYREEIPKSSRAIFNRINEISFNSSLLREMRSINFVKKIVENDWIKPEYRDHFHFTHLKMHSIRADDVTSDFSIGSKFSPDWQFLCHLRDRGREVARHWLSKNYEFIGVESTVDLSQEFS